MTIREYMNRKKRRIFALAFACFAPMLLGMILAAVMSETWLLLLAAPAFLGFILCVLYAHTIAFRCPRCRGPWHVLALQTGSFPFAIDRRLRYCPYCGADIDAKQGTKPSPDAADLLA